MNFRGYAKSISDFRGGIFTGLVSQKLHPLVVNSDRSLSTPIIIAIFPKKQHLMGPTVRPTRSGPRIRIWVCSLFVCLSGIYSLDFPNCTWTIYGGHRVTSQKQNSKIANGCHGNQEIPSLLRYWTQGDNFLKVELFRSYQILYNTPVNEPDSYIIKSLHRPMTKNTNLFVCLGEKGSTNIFASFFNMWTYINLVLPILTIVRPVEFKSWPGSSIRFPVTFAA